MPALNDDGTMDWGVDLGAMSAAKEDLVSSVMDTSQHDCEHPLTAHTGTEDTYPWKICARYIDRGGEWVTCGCQILGEI